MALKHVLYYHIHAATEDPICLPALEAEKEHQVHDRHASKPVGPHERSGTLHSTAGRGGINIHPWVTHVDSEEGGACAQWFGGDAV